MLLAQLVKGVGLASGAARTLAIVVLIVFGVALLIPDLTARIEAPLSRLGRFGPKTPRHRLLVGARRRRRARVRVRAVRRPDPGRGDVGQRLERRQRPRGLVAISYSVGLSAVLLVYAFAGRAVIDRIRRVGRGNTINRALGVVLLATGVLMIFNVDVRFEEDLAKDTSLPAILVDPTRSLENSSAVQKRLASLRPTSRFVTAQKEASSRPVSTAAEREVAIPGVKTPSLSDLGTAPNFTDNQDWFNTPGDRPLSLAELRGHVVLVDFWTYTCINCLRTLPFLKGLYAQYHKYGLDIVGVETPEFTFEQEAGNVRQAISSDGIKYPVVQDNKYGTWNAWQNQYWPAEYLIDAKGQVRHVQFGEGDYKQSEAAVRALLADAGAKSLPPPMTATAIMASAGLGTPETYLDTQRTPGVRDQAVRRQPRLPRRVGLALNQFALKGTWDVVLASITPVGPARRSAAPFRPQGLPRADLGRERPTPGPRAARRPADPERPRRRRRQQRRRDRHRPAPVLARLVPDRAGLHVHRAAAARRERLRLHVRLTTLARAGGRPLVNVPAPPRSTVSLASWRCLCVLGGWAGRVGHVCTSSRDGASGGGC